MKNIIEAILHYFTELWFLIRIEFSNVRDSWVWTILIASIVPMVTVFFLKFFLINPSEEVMMRVVIGNMIFPVIIMGITTLSQDISWARHSGHFTFYASLPISKINFVTAKILKGFLMTLPSVIIMSIIGQYVFKVHLHFSLGLVPVLILSIGSCVGFGTLIGFLSPNRELTNILGQVLLMLLGFLTPVMIDINQLPAILQVFSYFFPTTYAAAALINMLSDGSFLIVFKNSLILLVYTLFSMGIVLWKMDWRVEH